jgi:nucleoid-associated protein YgaU
MKSQTKGGDLNGAGVTTTAPGGKITGDTYTVQKGDTLFNIVVRAYNNSAMIRTVMRANRIWNANYIQSGMTLRLPR